MTDGVPRQLPQYVYRERTRHGKSVYYFRKGKARRLRLPDFGSADFEAAYHAALLGVVSEGKRAKPVSGTLGWLIEQYRQSSKYAGLSYATRRQRDNIFAGVKKSAGHLPYRLLTRQLIARGCDDRAATPHQARHFLDSMRGLCAWAVKAEYLSDNPAAGVENPPQPATDGYTPWAEVDVAAYERKWGKETRERVWMHVLLYTGLRRGDAVRLGRQHVRDGAFVLKTEKTGTEVTIPIRAELAETLRVGPTGDLAYVAGASGQPLAKESFGNMFRDACKAAGVTKSAHGLRKLAAIRAAEAGATVDELDALFGWSGGRTSSIYTRKADRKRLARRAMDKIVNAASPHREAGAPHLKKTATKTKA